MSSLNVRLAQKTRGGDRFIKIVLMSRAAAALAGDRRGWSWSWSRNWSWSWSRAGAGAGAGSGVRRDEMKGGPATGRAVPSRTTRERRLAMKRSPRCEMKTSLQWEPRRAGRSDTNSEGQYLRPEPGRLLTQLH